MHACMHAGPAKPRGTSQNSLTGIARRTGLCAAGPQVAVGRERSRRLHLLAALQRQQGEVGVPHGYQAVASGQH